MERFSQAYKVCRKVFQSDKFADDWHKFLHQTVKVSSLLGSHGPDPKHAGGLDRLREKILAAAEGKRGPLLTAAATTPASKARDTTPQRVASLKMLWHLYLTSERGGQNVWVYSPPSDYSQWVYDEIAGEQASYEPKVEKISEVYSADQRKVISTALAQALRASNNAIAKLGSPREGLQNLSSIRLAGGLSVGDDGGHGSDHARP